MTPEFITGFFFDAIKIAISLAAPMLLAGLAVGFWESQEEVRNSWLQEREFTPNEAGSWREELLQHWQREVAKA